MIVAGSANPLLLASAGGYNLTRSLRFRSSASAYLNRTPASAGTRTAWTMSMWVKRGSLATGGLFSTINSATVNTTVGFNSESIDFLEYQGATVARLITTQVFRDPSAWYHLVFVWDSSNATSTERVRLFVNGSRITSLSTASYPSLNLTSTWNNNVNSSIGTYNNGAPPQLFLDGYLTEVNFIDGQALTPSSFGQTSPTTGVWQPKKYAGTYGTNGFYLPFTDNSALTTSSNVGLGKDFSGNGNYFTTNNISITSGATYDSMTDVPTLTSATASNYCVLNPLNSPATTLSNANLTVTTAASGTNYATGTFAIPNSGKWYWEYVGTSNGNEAFCGVATSTASLLLAYYGATGIKWVNGSGSAYGATYTNNDVIGVAVDVDAGTVTFYKNNVSQGAITYSVTSDTFFPYFADGSSSVGATFQVNFGQRPFAYTPPTGFVALNTFNLPTPTIGATASTQANKYFTPLVYTGNGTNNRAITGVGFQPDLVWTKCRSTGYNNNIADIVRGANKTLYSNTTDAEATNNGAGYVSAFSSDGYTVTQGVDMNQVNANGDTYVSWNWKANGSGVTNTAGSITSTVSANTSAGFSVVTYTGNGSAGATIGHGLGVAPKMIIVKRRDGSVDDWCVYHVSIGNTGRVRLNTTAATQTNILFWNNTSPASTVFTVGADSGVNTNGGTYVAYCFSEIAGYSRFGSYTGNGSSDGTFVFTGFRPRFVMYKRTDSTGGWIMYDTARDPSNVVDLIIEAQSSGAEVTGSPFADIDFVSNGFKARGTSSAINSSGGTYIYMAFAENPFKYSLAR